MINFFSENRFELKKADNYRSWLIKVCASEKKEIGTLNYIFCNDSYLNKINREYLNHADYTDIISFDYSSDEVIAGDIFISTERVAENAKNYDVQFDEELRRVLVHGILHFCGYKDKTAEDSTKMREKEDEKMQLFHVEQL